MTIPIIKKREAKFYMGIGGKGIGKSFTSIQLMEQYKSGNPQTGLKPRKVLIFDVNDEFTQYNPIDCTVENICVFVKQPKIEIRRVSPKKQGRIKTMQDFRQDLEVILKYFMNGLLVLEDLTLIVGDAVSQNLVGALSTIRHKDVDVIIHFQSIAKFAHPKYKALRNVLRLHKASDSSNRSRVKENLGEDYPKVRIAELIVGNRYMYGVRKMQELEAKGRGEGDKEWEIADKKFRRFFMYVDFDNQKLFGNFSKKEFDEAVSMYLQEEEADEIRPMLKLRDTKTGVTKYNFQTAIKEKMIEFNMLYGNKA